MRSVAIALAFIIAIAIAAPPGDAARDIAGSAAGDELVVFETRPCPYCELFRRDVIADYQRSQQAAAVAIRFVDIAHVDVTKLALSGPLTMVPTTVLMRQGREAGRIAGYTAPDTFARLVAHLLGRPG